MKPDAEFPKRRFVLEEIHSKTSWNRRCDILMNPNTADNVFGDFETGAGRVADLEAYCEDLRDQFLL